MSWKARIVVLLLLFVAVVLGLFFGYPRGLSLILSYSKTCKALRVEPFLKGMIVQGQAQKFSIICDDGTICRAEDTGFAGVKAGDEIEFRGYPEFSTFEEFGKCDHAQLKRLIPAESLPSKPLTTGSASP
jgi:hypothetical protein